MYPSSPPSSPPSYASSRSLSRETSPVPGSAGDDGWQHPFSATSRAAGVRPPRYDVSHEYRRMITPPDTPPKTSTAQDAEGDVDMPDDIVLSDFEGDEDELEDAQANLDRRKRDADIWKDCIDESFDQTNLNVDLAKSNLHYIDACVGDLARLVVLGNEPGGPGTVPHSEFVRIDSAATARASSQRRLFGRTQTRSAGLSLYLAHNQISRLPPELFTLQQLVVLSLDNNNISVLPGAIGQLRALKLLNVARNKLETLPVELDLLRLDQLLVVPNSRLLRPDAPHRALETQECPSLTEFALRVLSAHGHEHLLRAAFEETLPPHVHARLRPDDAALSARFNVCAAHGRHFAVPGHTRVEFRTTLAGVRLTEPVPVLLRGCLLGCLDDTPTHVVAEADDDDFFMEDLGERVL